MAEYKHGIYTREIPTKVVPPIVSDVGLPVVIGTSPIHLARNPVGPHKPTLIFTYEEAVEKFGYSDDWESYTLCEFMYSHFVLYQRAPVVLINVLDLDKHIESSKSETVQLEEGKGLLETANAIPETIKVSEGNYELGKDFVVSVEEDDSLKITSLNEELDSKALNLSFSVVTPNKVDVKKDIIGGISNETGEKHGLELMEDIYPKFGKVPGLLLAPGFSSNSEVAAILNTKARNINGMFKANALIDAPTDKNYTEVAEWKRLNNVTDTGQIIGYPKLTLGDRKFHFSTQLAGVIARTDLQRGGVPYKSPSNERIEADGLIGDMGEFYLNLPQANYLNSNGIMTANNFNGWRSWGNETAAYPYVSDVKDVFIPVRRMFDWIQNTLILTYWSKIDDPYNRVLIETVIDSANIWFNGLAAQGFILGGRVSYDPDLNNEIEMMRGAVHFKVSVTPPTPAKEINFVTEYDVNIARAFINQMVQ